MQDPKRETMAGRGNASGSETTPTIRLSRILHDCKSSTTVEVVGKWTVLGSLVGVVVGVGDAVPRAPYSGFSTEDKRGREKDEKPRFPVRATVWQGRARMNENCRSFSLASNWWELGPPNGRSLFCRDCGQSGGPNMVLFLFRQVHCHSRHFPNYSCILFNSVNEGRRPPSRRLAENGGGKERGPTKSAI